LEGKRGLELKRLSFAVPERASTVILVDIGFSFFASIS
jgi:hypothetical protein